MLVPNPTDGHSGYTVLVIGGGPVGLTAAAAFAREGHRVTVLERHPGLQSPGGSMTIQSPAAKCLVHLGGKELLEKNSLPGGWLDNYTWWSYKEDAPMAVIPFVRISDVPRYQTDRPLVQPMLHALAVQAGAKVLFGKPVVRVVDDGSNRPRAWTQDGEEWEADLIVGADGIKSKTRRLLFPGKDVESVTTEERVFLTEVPESTLMADPRTAGFLDRGAFHVTVGPGRFCITRRRHIRDTYAMQLIVMKYGPPGPVDSTWNVPGDVDELRSLFTDFNEPTRAFLERVETTDVWQMAHARPLDSWRSEHGHIVLIGDAAHAMLPHKAQGLSQGIEDATALARLLRWGPDYGIPAVLECYERLRRPRVQKIVDGSHANAERNTVPDGPVQEKRDGAFRRMHGILPDIDWANVTPDSDAPAGVLGWDKWEQDYDLIAEVDRFMSNVDLSGDWSPGPRSTTVVSA